MERMHRFQNRSLGGSLRSGIHRSYPTTQIAPTRKVLNESSVHYSAYWCRQHLGRLYQGDQGSFCLFILLRLRNSICQWRLQRDNMLLELLGEAPKPAGGRQAAKPRIDDWAFAGNDPNQSDNAETQP
jgi:hypothetical protein